MIKKDCILNKKMNCVSNDPTSETCINCMMLNMVENFSTLFNVSSSSMIPFGSSGEIVSISKKHTELLEMYKHWVKNNIPEYYPDVIKYLENKNDKSSFMVV